MSADEVVDLLDISKQGHSGWYHPKAEPGNLDRFRKEAYIVVSLSHWDDTEFQLLLDLIATSKSLRGVGVGGLFLDETRTDAFVRAFQSNPAANSFCVQFWTDSESVTEQQVHFLSKHGATVTGIYLANMGTFRSEYHLPLAHAIRSTPNLKRLTVCEAMGAGFKNIDPHLQAILGNDDHAPALKVQQLAFTYERAVDMGMVLGVVSKNQSISSLVLKVPTPETEDQFNALIRPLKQNPAIQDLQFDCADLSGCLGFFEKLFDSDEGLNLQSLKLCEFSGCADLVQGLKRNTTLQHLGVQLEHPHADGVDPSDLVSLFAKPNPQLSVESLYLEQWSKHDNRTIHRMIRSQQCRLKKLELRVSLLPQVLSKLFRALKSNRVLKVLDLELIIGYEGHWWEPHQIAYYLNFRYLADLAKVLPFMSLSHLSIQHLFHYKIRDVTHEDEVRLVPPSLEVQNAFLYNMYWFNWTLESVKFPPARLPSDQITPVPFTENFFADVEACCIRNCIVKARSGMSLALLPTALDAAAAVDQHERKRCNVNLHGTLLYGVLRTKINEVLMLSKETKE